MPTTESSGAPRDAGLPGLHLGVHVRIDAATDAAEIDAIFADIGRRLRSLATGLSRPTSAEATDVPHP